MRWRKGNSEDWLKPVCREDLPLPFMTSAKIPGVAIRIPFNPSERYNYSATDHF